MCFGKRKVDQAHENRKRKTWGKARSWGGCLGGWVDRMRQAGPDGFGMGCGVGDPEELGLLGIVGPASRPQRELG